MGQYTACARTTTKPDPNEPIINVLAQRKLIEADNGRFDDNSDSLSFKQPDGFEGVGKGLRLYLSFRS